VANFLLLLVTKHENTITLRLLVQADSAGKGEESLRMFAA
jgi:hypothetical protein